MQRSRLQGLAWSSPPTKAAARAARDCRFSRASRASRASAAPGPQCSTVLGLKGYTPQPAGPTLRSSVLFIGWQTPSTILHVFCAAHQAGHTQARYWVGSTVAVSRTKHAPDSRRKLGGQPASAALPVWPIQRFMCPSDSDGHSPETPSSSSNPAHSRAALCYPVVCIVACAALPPTLCHSSTRSLACLRLG